jgi:DNA-binding PadR family transcriptional regulator
MRHVVTQSDAAQSKPLSEQVLLILVSLADKPRHGYALMRDIELLTDGRVRLTTGTLYGAISRLVRDGWIARFEQEDTSRDKQAYRLTTVGRRQMELEMNRMKKLTRTVIARLKPEEAK